MPFFDNTGVDPEVRRGPLWGAFATLFDQLERMIAANIAWALQLVPALLAAMYPEWPLPLRLALLLYSAAALAVATAILYGVARAAVEGEPITVFLVRDLWSHMALPGVLTLSPLYAIFGLLLSLSGTAYVVDVLARLMLMLCFLFSMYWGPLFAEQPQQPALRIFRRSAALFWRYPGRTLLVSGAVLLTLLVGAISIGGLFLIVPVLVTLLQTHMHQALPEQRS